MEDIITGDKNQVSRRKEIVELLRSGEVITVAQLSEKFDVSFVTIRKDLDMLENRGLLKRVHGGAQRIDILRQKCSRGEEFRNNEKMQVARIAAKYIEDEESVILNVGSTSALVCEELKCKKGLLLVTNAFRILSELADCRNITTVFLGGRIDQDMQMTVGLEVIEQLKKYRVDKLLLGMDGVDAVAGATSDSYIESPIMQQMIAQAKEKYLIVDDSKIGKVTFSHVADLTAFDGVITNYVERHEKEYAAIRELGVKVITE